MALQVSTTVLGFDVPEAYVRVVNMGVSRQAGETAIEVAVFKSALDLTNSLENRVFAAPSILDATGVTGDLRAVAYDYLKTLPEFAGALDV